MFKLVVLLVVLSIACYIEAGPARKIYQLKITSCSCSTGKLKCKYKQMGYGYVYKNFSSGRMNCRESRRITASRWSRTIIGFEYECTMPSKSGQFVIKSGRRTNCGKNYDKVMVNNCRYNPPCNSFGKLGK